MIIRSINTKEEYNEFKALALDVHHIDENNRNRIVNFYKMYLAHGRICRTCNDAVGAALGAIRSLWRDRHAELDEKFAHQDVQDYKQAESNGTTEETA